MRKKSNISVEQLLQAIDLLILDELDELDEREQAQREETLYAPMSHWQSQCWQTPTYQVEAC